MSPASGPTAQRRAPATFDLPNARHARYGSRFAIHEGAQEIPHRARLPHLAIPVHRAQGGYVEYRQHVPPGHFYSPIADLKEVDQFAAQVFDRDRRSLPAIDLREKDQLALAETLASYYPELPFTQSKKRACAITMATILYCHSDAIFLYAMMRHFRPKRIVEAGSGFSSAVMLDTNDLFFDGALKLEFIEPYPDRLYSLLTRKDRANAVIHVKKLQEMPVDYFRQLEAGDILFIDSSHVTRVAGEVNYYMFEILPALRPGRARPHSRYFQRLRVPEAVGLRRH